MRIGIDISAIIYGTGVSVYTKKLVENLLLIDSENRYSLFGGSLRRMGELNEYTSTLKGWVDSKILPIPPTLADFIWNRIHVLPIERLIGELDLYHTSDWAEPPSKIHKVTTIHDLSPILYPQFTHPRIVDSHKGRLKWVSKESDLIIVPSETTAQDAVNFGIAKEKIRVIPESHSLKKATAEEIEKVKSKYKLKGKYFLSVGANERKNTYRIVKAYLKIKSDINYALVIVGHPNFDTTHFKDVNFTGHVSDWELAALYSGSEALIYPSLYEGFGLPILEAFNLNIPVLTSSIGSMSEIALDGAILVDPFSVKSVTDGMKSVVENKNTLVKRGSIVVKKYSWKKTAQMTLSVYRELEF